MIERMVKKEVKNELREAIFKPLTLGVSICSGILGAVGLFSRPLLGLSLLMLAVFSGRAYYKLRGKKKILGTETAKRLRELRAKYEEDL